MDVPGDSIYMWMYTQGLKHVPLRTIEYECAATGKEIREKDYRNYWNGYYRSDLYTSGTWANLFKFKKRADTPSTAFTGKPYSGYPIHPYLRLPEVENRYVPCDGSNKPMIRWGKGCMTQVDATSMLNQVYLAENLAGTKLIVVDCDGDHDKGRLDMDVIDFLWKYSGITHTMSKPKAIADYEGYQHTDDIRPASFHLTFRVDKVIPTMHFPWCHMDIVGNMHNSLRYFKDKQWNHVPITDMTPEIWDDLRRYVERRRNDG